MEKKQTLKKENYDIEKKSHIVKKVDTVKNKLYAVKINYIL